MKSDTSSSRRNRHYLQIMFDVLEVCRQPQSRTRISHEANLNYRMLPAVLAVLKKHKLLDAIQGSTAKHVTTVKGKQYLQRYVQLEGMLEPSSEKPKTRDPEQGKA